VIGMAFRQMRAAILATAALTGIIVLVLAVLAVHGGIARGVTSRLRQACASTDTAVCHQLQDQLWGMYKMITPYLGYLTVTTVLVAAFWGAPMISREVETGTASLAWCQSVTRWRWFTSRLIVSVSAVATLGLLLGFTVTWWLASFTAAPEVGRAGPWHHQPPRTAPTGDVDRGPTDRCANRRPDPPHPAGDDGHRRDHAAGRYGVQPHRQPVHRRPHWRVAGPDQSVPLGNPGARRRCDRDTHGIQKDQNSSHLTFPGPATYTNVDRADLTTISAKDVSGHRSANSGYRCPTGTTQRKALRNGLRHQHEAEHSHRRMPAASARRVPTAAHMYRLTTATTPRFM
jgi:hypothetical protein